MKSEIDNYIQGHPQQISSGVWNLAKRVADFDVFPANNPFVQKLGAINEATGEDAMDYYISHRLERDRWLVHGLAEALVLGHMHDLYPEMMPEGATRDDLQLAVLIHDQGKPNASSHPRNWRKRDEELCDGEFSEFMAHVDEGRKILEAFSSFTGIKFSNTVFQSLDDHHEKLDGRGYPGHKTENEISPVGKLVTIVDQILSRCEPREYHKERFTISTACADVFRGSGTKYDPQILKQVIEYFRQNHHREIEFLAFTLSPWNEEEFINYERT